MSPSRSPTYYNSSWFLLDDFSARGEISEKLPFFEISYPDIVRTTYKEGFLPVNNDIPELEGIGVSTSSAL